MKREKKAPLSAKDIALFGMMAAVIEVCKVALMGLPNIELTTFWIIMFTLYFGNKVFYMIPVFILIEGAMFGFHTWWIMYLYTWPLLALITRRLKNSDSIWIFSILSGIFGLLFGLLCSLPYVVIGATEDGILGGLYAGFTWWVAGIPWDMVHCVGNFILMFVLYRPVRNMMNKLPHFRTSS